MLYYLVMTGVYKSNMQKNKRKRIRDLSEQSIMTDLEILVIHLQAEAA